MVLGQSRATSLPLLQRTGCCEGGDSDDRSRPVDVALGDEAREGRTQSILPGGQDDPLIHVRKTQGRIHRGEGAVVAGTHRER